MSLREDLRFHPQVGPPSYFLIEDLVRSKYYRVGVDEYRFICLLDGSTNLERALAQFATLYPLSNLTEREGIAICNWLSDNGLLQQGGAPASSKRAVEVVERLNPLMIRLPLLRPDPFFTRVAPLAKQLFRPLAVVVWLALISYAGHLLLAHWDQLTTASRQIFAPSNWIWLALCWAMLKVLHELAHGVVCKAYGGTVRQAGIVLVLFAPLAFVDVTSSWRFTSRWHRIFTATAGMYVELLVAALSAIVWTAQPTGVPGQLALNLIFMAGVSTVVVNANPLMRFDGYYILSDLLGIPNLYSSGQQYLKHIGRRYFLGLREPNPCRMPGIAPPIIRVYGVLAFLWRIAICAGLAIAASTMLHGLGAILALFAIGLWIGCPLFRLAKFLLRGTPGQPHRPLYFLTASGGSLALVSFVLFAIPWPGATAAPALVDYDPLNVVRARSAGFVHSIAVMDGQLVQPGEVLVELRNPELQLEVDDLKLQIEKSKVKSRRHEQQGELAAKQAELARHASLIERHWEANQRMAELTVRAPAAGQVIRRGLHWLQGTYVEEGDELLAIGDESHKEVELSISQTEVERFESRLGGRVHVRFPGQETVECRLDSIEPSATVRPTSWAFAASHGGPIAVQPTQGEEGGEQFDYLTPRFVGRIRLDREQSREFRAGQLAVVSFSAADERIGEHLYRWASAWIRTRLAAQAQ